MHGITADPDPIDGFVADVYRLCDRPIQFDRIEMLLIKVQRAGLVRYSVANAITANGELPTDLPTYPLPLALPISIGFQP